MIMVAPAVRAINQCAVKGSIAALASEADVAGVPVPEIPEGEAARAAVRIRALE
jgi:hypothetical protein